VGDADIRIKQEEFVNVKGELGGKEKMGEGPLERATPCTLWASWMSTGPCVDPRFLSPDN
jgi:hypothetical protein